MVWISLGGVGLATDGEKLEAQDQQVPLYESRFVEARGIRLHYMDFGGSGLPVLFLHGVHGDASAFGEFAPRFSDKNRVLALTRRGWGESEAPPWGYDVATQSEDILAFLDALEIGRAVLISNSRSPELIYIAEHHPERLAGLVFLDHVEPLHWGGEREPLRTFWMMNTRGACSPAEGPDLFRVRRSYRPHFIDDADVQIDVPALDFVNRNGRRLPEGYDYLTATIELATSPEWCDPTSKEYFEALAQNEERIRELRAALSDDVRANEVSAAFVRAFGARMKTVVLDVYGVTGYEYQRAAERIFSHIRSFLDGLH